MTGCALLAARASAADICNHDGRCVARESFEILDIGRRDDGTTGQIGDRNRECIDRKLRSRAGLTEELPGAYAGSRVDRTHLHAIAP